MCVWSAVHKCFNDWSFVDGLLCTYVAATGDQQAAQQRLLSQNYKQITCTQIRAALLALQFCCCSFNSPDYVPEASPT